MTQTDSRLGRQQPLGLTIPKSVAIIGCGGVGTWTAYFLALAGTPLIQLWDDDTISEHNCNRLPMGPHYIDCNKADSLKLFLEPIVPGCAIVSFPLRFSPSLSGDGGYAARVEWIVACTDTWASRRAIYEWSQRCAICGYPESQHPQERTLNQACKDYEPRAKYIEASAEGEFGGCTGSPADFTTPEEANPGYASVPVHVGPCVVSAAMTAYHILHNTNPGRTSLRFGWQLGIQFSQI